MQNLNLRILKIAFKYIITIIKMLFFLINNIS